MAARMAAVTSEGCPHTLPDGSSDLRRPVHTHSLMAAVTSEGRPHTLPDGNAHTNDIPCRWRAEISLDIELGLHQKKYTSLLFVPHRLVPVAAGNVFTLGKLLGA